MAFPRRDDQRWVVRALVLGQVLDTGNLVVLGREQRWLLAVDHGRREADWLTLGRFPKRLALLEQSVEGLHLGRKLVGVGAKRVPRGKAHLDPVKRLLSKLGIHALGAGVKGPQHLDVALLGLALEAPHVLVKRTQRGGLLPRSRGREPSRTQ